VSSAEAAYWMQQDQAERHEEELMERDRIDLFEVARVALNCPIFRETLGGCLDYTDEKLNELLDTVEHFLNKEEDYGEVLF